MANDTIPIPAADLAAKNKACFPNESPQYRCARNALLAEEIELRRLIERVASQRRGLPPGGLVPEDYVFEGAEGRVRLSQLFSDRDALVVYSMMLGPRRARAYPMCTAMLSLWTAWRRIGVSG